MKHKETKRQLTDKDRDAVLRLIVCGLSTSEIADTMRISRSTVSYVRQAHTACIEKDWSTLQKLSTTCRTVVDWAMRVTGTDKDFENLFKDEEPASEQSESVPAPTTEQITREDFLTLSSTMQDICYLLTEIRDMLK